MEAVIVNYRGGKHTWRGNQIILEVKDNNSKDLIGKKVVWASPAGKKINGEIIKVHGNSGCLIAKFERGLPGQALGKKIKVE